VLADILRLGHFFSAFLQSHQPYATDGSDRLSIQYAVANISITIKIK
jgi:hypothetical protein